MYVCVCIQIYFMFSLIIDDSKIFLWPVLVNELIDIQPHFRRLLVNSWFIKKYIFYMTFYMLKHSVCSSAFYENTLHLKIMELLLYITSDLIIYLEVTWLAVILMYVQIIFLTCLKNRNAITIFTFLGLTI